jgi:hypothetical protein
MKMIKTICKAGLSVSVLTAIITGFMHESDCMSFKLAALIMAICYLLFFVSFAVLYGLDRRTIIDRQ